MINAQVESRVFALRDTMAAARPGVLAKEVEAAARGVIVDAG